jgi:hypothetical protein
VSLDDILGRIVAALDSAGIAYMLTGSLASAHHGQPRSTQDIDIVITPTEEQLAAFLQLLDPQQYYVSQQAAFDAVRKHFQFNVIDFQTGWKIDFIVRKPRAFSRAEFDRRTSDKLFGMDVAIATAEDVVLAKLEWSKLGQSDRQLEDAAGVLRARGEELDNAYLAHWVAELGVEEQWRKARSLAGKIEP